MTACSPVGIGMRGCSTHLPRLAGLGATLVMYRCFSTVLGISVIDLSFKPRKSGSACSDAMIDLNSRNLGRSLATICALDPRPRARPHRANEPIVQDWALHSSDSRYSLFLPTGRASLAISRLPCRAEADRLGVSRR